jgi:membrane protein implicated in regulation of membrane protease activity
MMMWFWVGVFVIMVIIEAASSCSLVSIWFAIGALAGIIAAAFEASLSTQILCCVCVAAITMFMWRPYLKTKLTPKFTKTGVECLEGKIAVAIEEVSNTAGAVKVEGKEWNARTTGMNIKVGELCTILKFEGNKMIVGTNADSTEGGN